MKIEITRMNLVQKPDSKVLAFFSFGIWFRNDRPKAELEINDCRVMKSKDAGGDPWVVMPSKVNEKNGKFSSIVWIDDLDLKAKISDLALAKYGTMKPENKEPAPASNPWNSGDELPF